MMTVNGGLQCPYVIPLFSMLTSSIGAYLWFTTLLCIGLIVPDDDIDLSAMNHADVTKVSTLRSQSHHRVLN
jgi:hypothetical protein